MHLLENALHHYTLVQPWIEVFNARVPTGFLDYSAASIKYVPMRMLRSKAPILLHVSKSGHYLYLSTAITHHEVNNANIPQPFLKETRKYTLTLFTELSPSKTRIIHGCSTVTIPVLADKNEPLLCQYPITISLKRPMPVESDHFYNKENKETVLEFARLYDRTPPGVNMDLIVRLSMFIFHMHYPLHTNHNTPVLHLIPLKEEPLSIVDAYFYGAWGFKEVEDRSKMELAGPSLCYRSIR